MQKIKPDGGHDYVLATLCPFEDAFLARAAEIVKIVDNLPAEEKVVLICNLHDITRQAAQLWRAECQSWAACNAWSEMSEKSDDD